MKNARAACAIARYDRRIARVDAYIIFNEVPIAVVNEVNALMIRAAALSVVGIASAYFTSAKDVKKHVPT